MTLFFDARFDWPASVNSGAKVHTVRKSIRGVRPGCALAMVTGRFTNRVKFAERLCVSTQPVEIAAGVVTSGGEQIDPVQFALNSGLSNAEEMFAYYGQTAGYIIHWTNLRYQ